MQSNLCIYTAITIMNQTTTKLNFKHYIAGAASLTVEKTVLAGKTLPTISLEISKPKVDSADGRFDHDSKWAIQLHPLRELPDLMAVLMTYIPQCQFSYHSVKKNHGISVQWLTKDDKLKFTFLFEGKNRFIEMPRSKVFELMVFCSDVMINALKANQTISPNQFMSLQDVETYISRAYRKFKT